MKKPIRKNIGKKAQSIDMIYLPIILFVGLMVFLFLMVTVRQIYPQIIIKFGLVGDPMATALGKMPSILNLMTWGFGLVIFVIFLTTAILTRFHPLFIGMSVIILLVSIFLSGLFAEMFQAIVDLNVPVIADALTVATAVTHLGGHIPLIVLFVGIISLIFMYFIFSKRREAVEFLQ